ncbi:MAG: hypothetical protein ICV83_05875 [Cytophagales bacterium]|nr:hypothetical protein [Cytophagales bacterium]
MRLIPVFLLLVTTLDGCTSAGFLAKRTQQEQQRLERLLEHNRRLLENIRVYEAKLDTLEKMHQGQRKALYRVR